MQKKFFSNLIWLIFFNLLIKPYAIFGIDAEVQNRVGTETYGMYFTLLNFTLLFNILLDVGITNYNTRYVAQYPLLVKRYIGNMLSLKLILFLIYSVFTLFIAFVFGVKAQYYWFVLLLIINQLRAPESSRLRFKLCTYRLNTFPLTQGRGEYRKCLAPRFCRT